MVSTAPDLSQAGVQVNHLPSAELDIGGRLLLGLVLLGLDCSVKFGEGELLGRGLPCSPVCRGLLSQCQTGFEGSWTGGLGKQGVLWI